MTRVDRETGNCWECQGGLTCMHCHPEDNPKQTRRISELEAALRELVAAVDEQSNGPDPTARLVQAIRDAKSHIK